MLKTVNQSSPAPLILLEKANLAESNPEWYAKNLPIQEKKSHVSQNTNQLTS